MPEAVRPGRGKRLGLLALMSALSAAACLWLTKDGSIMPPLWLPNALAFAFLLHTGEKRTPALSVHAAAIAAANMLGGMLWSRALLFGALDAFTVAVGWWLSGRVQRNREGRSARELFALSAAVGLLAPLLIGTLASAGFALFEQKNFPDLLLRWVSSEALGAAMVVPWALVSRAALARVERERRKLETYFDNSGVGTWSRNLAAGSLQVDSRYAEMLGRAAHEFVDAEADWLALVHPEDVARYDMRGSFSGVTGQEGRFSIEYRMRHADGHWVWLLDAGRVLDWDEHGRPLRVAGVHLDISRRKAAEEALATREARHQALIETTSDGFIITDNQGRLREVNAAYAAKSGYSVEELLQLDVFALRAYSDHQNLLDRLANMRPGSSQVFESVHKRKDGSLWDVEVSLCYLGVGDGEYCAFVRDISERKQAADRLMLSEFMLEDSNRRLTVAVDSAAIGVWDYDVANARLSWDERMLALYGRDSSSFGGRLEDWRECVHPDDRHRVWVTINDTLENGSALDLVFRADLPYGGIRWLKAYGRVERSVVGNPLHFTGVSYDITERYRREDELWEERRRFQDLVDSTDGIVWEVDVVDHCFTFVSAQAERLLGYPLSAWYRRDFWVEHMHPDDRAWVPDYSLRETAALRAHNFEYRMLASDGRVLWLRDMVSVVAEAGVPRLLRGVMIDITEQRRVQALAEATASRLGLALRAGGIGIWEVDLDSGVQIWDAQMYALFGRSVDSEPRQILREQLDAAALRHARSAFVRAHKRGESYEHEYRVALPDGGERYLKVHAAVLPDPGRGRGRLVGATWDCSAQRQLEQDLRSRQQVLQSLVQEQTLTAVAARQRAERAASLQAEFLANVSHELRTPLHVIIGFITLADEGLQDMAQVAAGASSAARAQLARSTAAAKRLLALVDDLLDLAKLESGRMELRLELRDIAVLIDLALEELGPLLLARHIHIERQLPVGPASLRVDERRVIQVFRNVLANAARFSPEHGRIGVTVSATVESGRPWVEVMVEDEGVGIPAGEIDLIFDKFVQGSRKDGSKTGGTGLGLPIAREIMRAHGGEIFAENRIGHGARFVMRFSSERRSVDRDVAAESARGALDVH